MHLSDRHGEADTVLARIRGIVADNVPYVLDCVSVPSDQGLAAWALSKKKRGRLARLVRDSYVDNQQLVIDSKAGLDLINVFGLSQLTLRNRGAFLAACRLVDDGRKCSAHPV